MSTLPNIEQHRDHLIEVSMQLLGGLITVTEAVMKVYGPGKEPVYHIEQILPGRIFYNRTLIDPDTNIEYFDTLEVGFKDKVEDTPYFKCSREEHPPLHVMKIIGSDDDSFPC